MSEKTEEKEACVPAPAVVSSPPAEAASPAARRTNGAAGLGFALALIGLLFFWVPVVGVVFWFLGLLFSFAGVFSAPRGFAFSGIAVSAVACGFILFLAQGGPFEYVVEESRALFRTEVADGTYVRPSRKASDALNDVSGAASASGARVVRREPSSSAKNVPAASDGRQTSAPGGNSSASVAATEEGSLVRIPPFPVARFEEISRRRTTWPTTVRLTRARKISLWDEEAKVIMGKMEIPAGSVVEVLDVRSDGVLEALDCTGQRFKILAADTNFAELYTLKNMKWGAE